MLTENNDELIIREFDDEEDEKKTPSHDIKAEEEDFDFGMDDEDEDEDESIGSLFDDAPAKTKTSFPKTSSAIRISKTMTT